MLYLQNNMEYHCAILSVQGTWPVIRTLMCIYIVSVHGGRLLEMGLITGSTYLLDWFLLPRILI